MNTKSRVADKKIIIDATVPKELRVAILQETTKRNTFNLTDLHVEDKNHLQYKSNIYLGTITSIETSLNAAFVQYDNNKRHGFLPFKEIQPQYYEKADSQKNIKAPNKPANTSPESSPSENAPSIAAKNAEVSADSTEKSVPSQDINQDADKTTEIKPSTESTEKNAEPAKQIQPDTKPTEKVAAETPKQTQLDTKATDKNANAPKQSQSTTQSTEGDDAIAISVSTNPPIAHDAAPINFTIAEDEPTKKPPQKKPKPESKNSDTPIAQTLKLGQQVLVQVVKEERGSKGAALTTHVSLAGSYLVLMPNNAGISGISRRIEGNARDEVRSLSKQLNCPDNMGFIIRTAGINQDVEQLQWDLDVLVNLWKAITQAVEASKPPVLIHQESDVVVCAVRDYLRSDVQELIVNDKDTFDKIHFYLSQVKPEFVNKLSHYQEEAPLFCHYSIENQIEQAQQREVRLPSGGSIMIDHTEALVAIDVNSARAKGSNIEDTAYQTNIEAADEVGRQLRLRDLGGLVVIDFIDMSQQKHQRNVEHHLRNSLAEDRARIRIGRISTFGLLEMSRQRLRTSLGEVTKMSCPRCNGQGLIQNVDSFSVSLLRRIREDVLTEQLLQIQLHVPLDVSAQLMNHHRMDIADIETHGKTSVLIIPNANFHTPQHKVKKIRFGEKGTKAAQMESKSYQLMEPMKAMRADTQPSNANQHAKSPENEPVVNSADIPQPERRKIKKSLVKKLWDNMFSTNKVVVQAEADPSDETDQDDNIGNRKTETAPRSNPNPRRRHPQRRNNRNGKPSYNSNHKAPTRDAAQNQGAAKPPSNRTGNVKSNQNPTHDTAKNQGAEKAPSNRTGNVKSNQNPTHDTAKNQGAEKAPSNQTGNVKSNQNPTHDTPKNQGAEKAPSNRTGNVMSTPTHLPTTKSKPSNTTPNKAQKTDTGNTDNGKS